MSDGPTVKLELSCFGCKHVRTERYQVQGDSGMEVFCDHPHFKPGCGLIGDTHWRTPAWCPLRAAAIKAALKPLGLVPIAEVQILLDAWRQSWDCSHDPGHSIMDAAVRDAELRLRAAQ